MQTANENEAELVQARRDWSEVVRRKRVIRKQRDLTSDSGSHNPLQHRHISSEQSAPYHLDSNDGVPLWRGSRRGKALSETSVEEVNYSSWLIRVHPPICLSIQTPNSILRVLCRTEEAGQERRVK